MTTYETAPACTLLATNCAVCNRPLLDAVSIERGIGPDCAKKYGYDAAQQPANFALAASTLAKAGAELDLTDTHAAANKLVWLIAANGNAQLVAVYVEAIAALGFVKLARRLADRLGCVEIEPVGSAYHVKAPYSMLDAMRSLPGRRWDAAGKVNVIPCDRMTLWRALRRLLPAGTLVAGPAGVAALLSRRLAMQLAPRLERGRGF